MVHRRAKHMRARCDECLFSSPREERYRYGTVIFYTCMKTKSVRYKKEVGKDERHPECFHPQQR